MLTNFSLLVVLVSTNQIRGRRAGVSLHGVNLRGRRDGLRGRGRTSGGARLLYVMRGGRGAVVSY